MNKTCFLALTCAVALGANAAGQNLLSNPSFEVANPLDPSLIEASFEDWTAFNNVFTTSDNPRTGVGGGLILGPFFNLPNVSGIFQDVPASPGDIFEGSFFLLNDTTTLNGDGNPDVIAGTGNEVSVAIEWINAAGDNIGTGASSLVFDGQDPNLVLDEFVLGSVVSPPAPADVAAARLVLLFLQPPTFDGGLVFFDDASLTLVPEPSALALVSLAAVGYASRRRRR